MQSKVSIAVLLFAAASLFGWGQLVRRIGRLPVYPWPVTICVGLGAVLFVGGIVNLARIAFAATLWTIVAIGLVFFVFTLRQARASVWLAAAWTARTLSERIEIVATVAFISAIAGFTIATQLPPDVFNFHDDFHKYFAHPVRQLATGTLFGSPLSALGSETLGGMAFLHSFVLSVFPIQYINGVDTVFGFVLLMALGAVAGWRRMAPLPGALFAPLLIACIDPQYVNVSALYIAGALTAAAILLTAGSGDDATEKPPALALGLVYGGLVTLKPTFAIFPALHLSFLVIGLSVAEGSLRRNIGWALRVTMWSALLLAPWVALHAPHYLNWSDIPTDVPAARTSDDSEIFSATRPLYGASPLAGLIGLAVLVTGLGLGGYRKTESTTEKAGFVNLIAAALAGVVTYFVFLFLLPPIATGVIMGIRYMIPILIGIIPVIVVLCAGRPSTGFGFARIGIPLLALLASVATFLPSMRDRYVQAAEYRSILAFTGLLRDPAYPEYNRMALSPERAQAIRKLQELIPANEPVLAWINQPFDLDFRRNPIIDVEPAGLATPWARMPPVHYVMWEYKGFGTRTPQEFQNGMYVFGFHNRLISTRSLNFGLQLGASIGKGTILYSDGSLVVARLPSP